MGSVHKILGGLTASISSIAAEFDIDRRTATKRLEEAGVVAAGMVRGHAVYRWRDAARAIYGAPQDHDGPEQLPPMERRAWFQSEDVRLSVETKKRNLIPAGEAEIEFAFGNKLIVQRLDTLAEFLAREAGLTPEQEDLVQRYTDQMREDMYRDQVQSDVGPPV